MARAGGKDPEKLADALARARELISAALCVKVLALDYGSARTGVAVSDPTGTVARPVGVVEQVGHARPASSRLLAVIRDEEPERVVVGLPLTLRGEHGEQADETRGVRRGASRRRSRFRSRPTTSGSPRRSPAATTPAPPRTCCRATSSGAPRPT